MNAEVKKKWIKALRSGRYRQARGQLSEFDSSGRESNCCLGVLCRVERVPRHLWADFAELSEVGADEFQDRVDLKSDEETQLIYRNDGMKDFEGNPQSFSEIADYIEAKL